MELCIDQVTYKVDANHNDTDNSRLWFIISKQPKTEYDFFEANQLSKYWQNYKKKKCQYDVKVMQLIKDK